MFQIEKQRKIGLEETSGGMRFEDRIRWWMDESEGTARWKGKII